MGSPTVFAPCATDTPVPASGKSKIVNLLAICWDPNDFAESTNARTRPPESEYRALRAVNSALLMLPGICVLTDGVTYGGDDIAWWFVLFALACFALAARELWSSPPPPEHHVSPEQREAVHRAIAAAFESERPANAAQKGRTESGLGFANCYALRLLASS